MLVQSANNSCSCEYLGHVSCDLDEEMALRLRGTIPKYNMNGLAVVDLFPSQIVRERRSGQFSPHVLRAGRRLGKWKLREPSYAAR